MKLCSDCSNCPMSEAEKAKGLSIALNVLFNKFGDIVLLELMEQCTKFVECPVCHGEEFFHKPECEIYNHCLNLGK